MDQKVIDFNPKWFVGYNQIAWNYTKRGIQLEKALGKAQKAYDLAPDNGEVNDTLGWIYYRKKEYKKANRHSKGRILTEYCRLTEVGRNTASRRFCKEIKNLFPQFYPHLLHTRKEVLKTSSTLSIKR